jgi:DNA-binding HxlR family transcriptional regulator
METNRQRDVLPDAEMVRQLNTLADKWTLAVAGLLLNGPQRFSTLLRTIPGISQKMLTQTLRELERNGIVERTVYPQIPPRVEYAVTPLGETMCDPIKAFERWINAHRAELEAARAAYDQRPLAEQHSPVHPLFGTRPGIAE